MLRKQASQVQAAHLIERLFKFATNRVLIRDIFGPLSTLTSLLTC
jgi:hypothetical protein